MVKSAKPNSARRSAAGFLLLLALLCSGCGERAAQVSPPGISDDATPPPKSGPPLSATLPMDQKRDVVADTAASADGWFRDMAETLGVSFAYHDGSEAGCYQLLESVGGGVLSTDYDCDGGQDLYFFGGGSLTPGPPITVGGRSGGLFRNGPQKVFGDATRLAGLHDERLYTHGGAVGDLDGDGFEDLIVCGFGGVQIWINNGDGTFHERSQAWGVTSELWNVSAAVADYDMDGLADIYLLTYADWKPDADRQCLNDKGLRDICGPTLWDGAADVLLRNTGFEFEDVTSGMKLVSRNRGLGIIACDLTSDRTVDFAVVNDVQENQLYLNTTDKPFQDVALVWGMAYSDTGEREGSMGIDVADFNRDGRPDLWYTNYAQQDNSLLRNSNGTGLLPASRVTRLSGVSRQWVGFGTGFADFDGDHWDDLFVINGHVAYERLDSPYFQPPQLFRNRDGKAFDDVSIQGGAYFQSTRSGRGAAVSDFDNNGSPDLVVSHQNDPVAVLRNMNPVKHWLSVKLVGTQAERCAVGASVTLAAQEPCVRKWVVSGGSYLSRHDPRLVFSLDSKRPVDVIVTWPGGNEEAFSGLATGTLHNLIQGRGNDVGS